MHASAAHALTKTWLCTFHLTSLVYAIMSSFSLCCYNIQHASLIFFTIIVKRNSKWPTSYSLSQTILHVEYSSFLRVSQLGSHHLISVAGVALEHNYWDDFTWLCQLWVSTAIQGMSYAVLHYVFWVHVFPIFPHLEVEYEIVAKSHCSKNTWWIFLLRFQARHLKATN